MQRMHLNPVLKCSACIKTQYSNAAHASKPSTSRKWHLRTYITGFDYNKTETHTLCNSSWRTFWLFFSYLVKEKDNFRQIQQLMKWKTTHLKISNVWRTWFSVHSTCIILGRVQMHWNRLPEGKSVCAAPVHVLCRLDYIQNNIQIHTRIFSNECIHTRIICRCFRSETQVVSCIGAMYLAQNQQDLP
jgi:hypothetical protein